ncbi:MAG: hypothetical protein CVU56_09705 [Deltaproteobacteria bacterium HGW-Deltaproteobacteria-14]|nr:MAG: hypothetical protein CVU56_09705 [Deltaproteobacteria bacterium HGW-Deltaproteobacteria-14]
MVALVACGGDGGQAGVDAADSVVADTAAPPEDSGATDTAGPDAAADTAGVADTADDARADTSPPDTTPPADTSAPSCEAGATVCDGYLLMRCSSTSHIFEVDRVCPLGCSATSSTAAACDAGCTPGAPIGCVTSTARRCGADGASALALSCLSGCDADAAGCAPLGGSEREVFAANVSGVRVAGVGGDDQGRLAFAWQANVTGTPEPIRVLVTDADGNALSSSIALGGSDAVTFSQLVVRGAPSGAFVVLALDPSGATFWHLPVTAAGLPQPSSAPLAADLDLSFPSLVVWQDAVALYDLAPGAAAGRTQVRRTQWALSGGAPVEATVDGVELDRNDVVATRVGATTAHVFSAVSGQLRVTLSSPDEAGGTTLAFDAGELLFAGAAGVDGRSVVAAFDFASDPEHAVYARFDGASLGAFGDVGPGRWFQAAATGTGVAVALQTSGGGLEYGAASGATAGTPAPLWTPSSGADRSDFWVVYDAVGGRVRLVTLGKNGAAEPPRVRISAP